MVCIGLYLFLDLFWAHNSIRRSHLNDHKCLKTDPKPIRNHPSTWYHFIPLSRCGFPCSTLGHCVLGAERSVFWMDSASTEHRGGHTPLVIQGIFLNVFQDVHIIARIQLGFFYKERIHLLRLKFNTVDGRNPAKLGIYKPCKL